MNILGNNLAIISDRQLWTPQKSNIYVKTVS